MKQFSDPLNKAAERFFGAPYLFPYQRLVITNILEAAGAAGIPFSGIGASPATELEKTAGNAEDRETGGRQIVVLPTGAGKSLCFQLPAVLLEGATLVIYPILSLMADQERRLRERGLEPAVLRGGQSPEERRSLWEKIRSGHSRFIIANPEVLLTPQMLKILGTLHIVHTVIDEAHCVSEWGESFRPSYLAIPRIISAAKAKLVTAFTATASAPVLEKIGAYLFSGQGARRIIGNPDRTNIRYTAQGCLLRDLAVRDLLLKRRRPALVFCASRTGAETLARYLRNELGDKEIRFYHAGLSREEKTAAEQWFFAQTRGILTATCAYGMGVDKPDIRTVIHRDCPPSVEAYLQESGRAGRDGFPAQAVLLWGPDDEEKLARAKTEPEKLRLARLFEYARNTGECRRAILLSLLDYEGPPNVSGPECCDVCAQSAKNALREEPSLREFFRRNPRRYTIAEASRTLARIEQFRWSREDAETAILHLIKADTLKRLRGIFWKDKLTLR
ncbi:MAG: RecQ family ATP-dependent DNA helicase [Spirochaetaceae bacterium]|jgi:ATP-dependent DNA helicase RecQ|nr:RecQ family ATP-dependent DNA helicase [Spirochaetaceae bacterium]